MIGRPFSVRRRAAACGRGLSCAVAVGTCRSRQWLSWAAACWAATFVCPTAPADDAPRRIAGAQLTVELGPREVVVRDRGDLLLTYRYADISHKPYVAALTTARGENVLRDAPADHLHHHGLMFACGVDGVNYWEERAEAGRQVHAAWSRLEVLPIPGSAERPGAAPEAALLEETLHWQRPNGARPLAERRTIVVFAPTPAAPRLLTWQTALTAAADGPGVTLAGSNYYGLGMRFVAELDRPGRFFAAAGKTGVDGTNGARAPWCAYAAALAPDRPVTLAMFDAADNPRHPATWFTMDNPFAYLSATLGLASEPVALAPGQTLSLRYGVAVLDSDAAADQLAAAHRHWQELLAALPPQPTAQ